MSKTDNLRYFFVNQLNRLFCSASHLLERFPEIIDQPEFADLKPAITDAIHQTEIFIDQLDELFTLLVLEHSFDNCTLLISSLENEFQKVQENRADEDLKTLFILSYLLKVECVQSMATQLLYSGLKYSTNPQVSYLISTLSDSHFTANSLKFMLGGKTLNS